MLYQDMIIAEFDVTRETAQKIEEYMTYDGFDFSSASKREIICKVYYVIHALGDMLGLEL